MFLLKLFPPQLYTEKAFYSEVFAPETSELFVLLHFVPILEDRMASVVPTRLVTPRSLSFCFFWPSGHFTAQTSIWLFGTHIVVFPFLV
jgi:hypothetical protein